MKIPNPVERRTRAAARGLSCLTLASALFLAHCGRPVERATDLAPMPDFSLASLGGETVVKADFLGKVVLFEFWATWCGPCHLQADILKDLYPGAAKRGIEFLAISTGEETPTVREFVGRRPFPYAVLVDPEEVLGGPLEIMALPTLVIMDRKGQIAWRHTGVADGEAIEAALQAVLAGSGRSAGSAGSGA